MTLGHRYFAHSENPAGHRHTLREHLGCVAEMAAEFAHSVPWQSEARLAGQLHDLGKYGDLFQRRLEGLESGLDHWSAGAFVAGASFGTLAAAVAIEGHHIGLQPALKAAFSARQRDIKARHPLGLRLSESDFVLLRRRAELDGLKFGFVRRICGRVLAPAACRACDTGRVRRSGTSDSRTLFSV